MGIPVSFFCFIDLKFIKILPSTVWGHVGGRNLRQFFSVHKILGKDRFFREKRN